MQLILHY